MINKLISKGNITELETKLAGRLSRAGQLIFGNRLQLAEIKILNLINELKYNEDYFKECESCRDKISVADLKEVDNSLYCDNCISEKFYSCEGCGELIYNEDIYSFEAGGYCEACYFKVKQEAYKSHKIISHLLIKLAEVEPRYNLSEVEFKIEGNLWQIESYARNSYRLGSWGANCWIDIGNNKEDLIKAIDFNLGNNRDKLTNIYLNKDTEIEL
jgi:hypothetical protein